MLICTFDNFMLYLLYSLDTKYVDNYGKYC